MSNPAAPDPDASAPPTVDWTAIRQQNQQIIDGVRSARASGSMPPDERQLLLLTTTGRRSGQQHTVPLGFDRDGDRLTIVASKAGMPTDPQWFANLVANPDVTVEVGLERFDARAEVPTGAERDRVFAAQVARQPVFAEYQQRTTRLIPVVVLTRVRDTDS